MILGLTGKTAKYAILAILPILLVITSIRIGYEKGPYWLGMNSDPEYVYLLNSLNIIDLKSPAHIDHPGTPLQILGAIVILIFYVARWATNTVNSTLIEDVLKNPESYLVAINFVLLLMAATTIFLVGLLAAKLSRNLPLALTLQFSPFLLIALTASNRVSPEPLLFILSQALVALLLIYLFKPEDNQTRWLAIRLGIVFGLGIATKVTFLPLTAAIFILPKPRQKLISILVAIATFFIATLPIVTQYPKMFGWLYSIASHTGPYGSGDKGFLKLNEFWANLTQLASQDHVFFLLVGLSTLGYVFFLILPKHKIRSLDADLARTTYVRFHQVLGCVLAIIFIQLLITIKHPGSHYIVPSVGLAGLLIFIQVSLLMPIVAGQTQNHGLPVKLISIAALALCIALASININDRFSLVADSYRPYYAEVKKVQALLDTDYKDCAHITYYRSSSKPFSLRFGNGYTLNNFSDLLTELYPNSFFYDIWNRVFGSFSETVELEAILKDSCAVLQGTPFNSPGFEQYSPSIPVKDIFVGKTEALYQISSPG